MADKRSPAQMPDLMKYVRKKDRSAVRDFLFADNYKILLEALVTMYDFTGLPETFNPNFFLMYAIECGGAVMYRSPESWGDGIITAPAKLAGHPDPYGMGEDLIVTTEDGHSTVISKYKDSPDVEVFFLNRLYAPDFGVSKTAEYLTETQLSIRAILLMARYSKIIEAPDSRTKEQLEAAIKNSELGAVATFVGATKNPLIQDAETIKDISLTDVRNSDMIQYLSKYQDDILRGFYSRYGMETMGAAKIAQQTTDEVNSGSFRSMIVPISRLILLDDFIKRCNEKFSLSASVDFSEPWKLELQKIISQEISEESPEDPENTDDTDDAEEGGTDDDISGTDDDADDSGKES